MPSLPTEGGFHASPSLARRIDRRPGPKLCFRPATPTVVYHQRHSRCGYDLVL